VADNPKKEEKQPNFGKLNPTHRIYCNNRYEQLSRLPGDDNVDDNNNDTTLTDRTNSTQTNGETSKLQDPKPPPIFIYRVTICRDIVAHLSATIEKEQYHCKVI
jgi:hypothetical protein